MIRSLQPNEISKITHLGPLFWKEANLPGEFIESVFIRKWSELIEQNHGRIFVAFRGNIPIGALGLFIVNDTNDDARIASEAFWFMDKSERKGGLALFFHAEKYAKASGCKRMAMVHLVNLHPDALEKFYIRNGYRCVEKSYHKTF